MIKIKKIIVFILFLSIFFSCINISSLSIKQSNERNQIKKTYKVHTQDLSKITLTNYPGNKTPIILLHGFTCSHIYFDFDENHSLAQYLHKDGWDVWMLDLRTHDGDGDFWFDKNSNREYINRYWDFDRTYVKKDLVTAMDFIKEKTSYDKLFMLGHSMGGYLCYAYAELVGQDDISGIIVVGSSPYANPTVKDFSVMHRFGFKIGNYAFVLPFGAKSMHFTKNWLKNSPIPNNFSYHNFTTPHYIQEHLKKCHDDEPAGVYVDMMFGRDKRFYDNHWVDPQTLYDYTENLNKIYVPFLAISGEKDIYQDPPKDMYMAFENISSTNKDFFCYSNYSHCDLLLGDKCKDLIFPTISNWMKGFEFKKVEETLL